MSDENLIRREFPVVLEPSGDGRTLDLRIVPYNTPARVSDGDEPYMEEWAPGVFDRQKNAASRVLVNFEHQRGLSNVVGRGDEFHDSEDGFDASVRILSGADGDKALELVRDKVLAGVSLEAIPLKSEVSKDGVVRRIKARLVNIALCRFPAFEEAQVLAVREEAAGPVEAGQTYLVGEAGPEIFVPKSEGAIAEGSPSRVEEILGRIGVEPMHRPTIANAPWGGDSPERFSDEEFERSCLVMREGEASPKELGVLPILEPNGDLNTAAMRGAATRLSHAGLTPELRGRAARKLIRYYRLAGEEPPSALVATARL